MQANIDRARQFRDHPGLDEHSEMQFTFAWNSFDHSAWNSARDSGALTYMPIEEVQRYSDAYEQQEFINHSAVDIFTHQIELAAPLFMEDQAVKGIPPAHAEAIMQGCAVTYLRLVTERELVEQLVSLYARTLKTE